MSLSGGALSQASLGLCFQNPGGCLAHRRRGFPCWGGGGGERGTLTAAGSLGQLRARSQTGQRVSLALLKR